MSATHISNWFGPASPEPRWPSFGISVAVTAALFTLAAIAMRSVRESYDRTLENRNSAVLLHFDRPEPAAPRRPRPTIDRPQPAARAAPTPAKTSTEIHPAPNGIAPVVAPPSPAARPVERDSAARGAPTAKSGAAGTSEPIPLGILPPPYPAGALAPSSRGAPMAPAGVTIGSRVENTARYRDSILHARMNALPELARTHNLTADELAEAAGNQRFAETMQRRANTAGNRRDVAVLTGSGNNGVGASDGGQSGLSGGGAMGGLGVHGSIPFPLFSSGPSPTQRKKNERIDAAARASLRALQDRVLLKRDSIRADSLRRDAVRRDSLAKARVVHPAMPR